LYYNVYILDLVSFLIVLYTYINIIFYISFYLFSWYLRGLQSARHPVGAPLYLTTASDSSPLPLLGVSFQQLLIYMYGLAWKILYTFCLISTLVHYYLFILDFTILLYVWFSLENPTVRYYFFRYLDFTTMYGLAENPIVHYYLVYYQFFVLYVLLSLNPLVHYYVFRLFWILLVIVF